MFQNLLKLLLLFGALPALAQTGDQLTLLNLLNAERAKAGLPRLEWDEHLAQSATAHARQLVQHHELSHQFNGEPVLGDRIGATGLRFNSAAENVAFGPSIETIHKGLMDSPPHRANILDPKYNAVGIAILPGDTELYAAQNFARVVPTYSESQFRDAVIAAFQRARTSKKLAPLIVAPDDRLHNAACSNPNPNVLIKKFTGVTDMVVFTASVPENLSASMKAAALDPSLRRMNIGVCFKPGPDHGYASFWVVAGFYPTATE